MWTRFLTFAYLPAFNMKLFLYPFVLSFDWGMDTVPPIHNLSDTRNVVTIVFYGCLLIPLWQSSKILLKQSKINNSKSSKSTSSFLLRRQQQQHHKRLHNTNNSSYYHHQQQQHQQQQHHHQLQQQQQQKQQQQQQHRKSRTKRRYIHTGHLQQQHQQPSSMAVVAVAAASSSSSSTMSTTNPTLPMSIASRLVVKNYSICKICSNNNNNNVINNNNNNNNSTLLCKEYNCQLQQQSSSSSSHLIHQAGTPKNDKKFFRILQKAITAAVCNFCQNNKPTSILTSSACNFPEHSHQLYRGSPLPSSRSSSSCSNSTTASTKSTSSTSSNYSTCSSTSCSSATTAATMGLGGCNDSGNNGVANRTCSKLMNKKCYNSVIFLMSVTFLTLPFLPASNLFFYVGFVVAERILYLPSVGYCLLFGFAVEKVLERTHSKKSWRLASYALLGLMLSVYSVKTFVRNYDWKNDESLYRSAIGVNPPKGMFYNVLFLFLFVLMLSFVGTLGVIVGSYSD